MDKVAGDAAGTPSIMELVSEQAEDDGLWFVARTASESYLQSALRRLHAAIEGERHTPTDFDRIDATTGTPAPTFAVRECGCTYSTYTGHTLTECASHGFGAQPVEDAAGTPREEEK
jgi:hypothetical protein